MKGSQVGEFEEVVLLTTALLYNDAYSVAIMEQELSQRLQRPVSLNAAHRTLPRLEEKGWVQLRFGESPAERGGRRKCLFTVTTAREQVLHEACETRNELWLKFLKVPLERALHEPESPDLTTKLGQKLAGPHYRAASS